MAASEPIRVLLVDDDEDDYLITLDMLGAQDRVRFTAEWRSDYAAALGTIREQRHDVYLIDYRLGSRTGLELVREGFARRPRAPVIMLTGQSDYEIDLEASALGITDYLVKQELEPIGLERSIRYAVSHHRALDDLALSEERYALATRAANDGIWDWDLIRNRIYFSPRWHSILGQPERLEDEDPAAWFDLVHHEDLPALSQAIGRHLSGRSSHLQSEHRIRHADGAWRWVLTRGLAIRDEQGRAARMAGSLSDITDRRAAELQLQHDALHDSLTGLPNRALFMDRLEQVVEGTRRDPGYGCAVLFMDIDRFKLVNDSLSHAVGDDLLVALAERVRLALRPGDTVARIGGDEFTMLLDGIVSEADARAAVERIHEALRPAFEIDGHQLFVAASVGISLTAPGLSGAEVLRNADIAMYDAKRSGQPCAMFDESMHRRVVARHGRENDLRQAVAEDLIEVHYQPIAELATGRIVGLEALARWPTGWPRVSPVEFIAIAEDTGAIGQLGLQVMAKAVRTLVAWRYSGIAAANLRISVNVSARQLDDPTLPQQIAGVIAEAGLPGSALRLEITESALMQHPERVRKAIAEICATGVALHLDDFGTGYSSLAALHRFSVETLKIDRSFISSIDEPGGGSETIIRSTVALAHSLGLGVVAEGIEGSAQLERLRGLGCDHGQGFLFSPPLDGTAMETLLSRRSAELMAGADGPGARA